MSQFSCHLYPTLVVQLYYVQLHKGFRMESVQFDPQSYDPEVCGDGRFPP